MCLWLLRPPGNRAPGTPTVGTPAQGHAAAGTALTASRAALLGSPTGLASLQGAGGSLLAAPRARKPQTAQGQNAARLIDGRRCLRWPPAARPHSSGGPCRTPSAHRSACTRHCLRGQRPQVRPARRPVKPGPAGMRVTAAQGGTLWPGLLALPPAIRIRRVRGHPSRTAEAAQGTAPRL